MTASPALPFSTRWVIAILGFTAPLLASVEAPVNDKPVELPEFNVVGERELAPPEPWYYARVEGFEVLSSASESRTREMVTELQRYAFALNTVWPGMKPNRSTPTALVICGSNAQFARFSEGGRDVTEQGITSFSLHTREYSALLLAEGAKIVNLAPDDVLTGATSTTTTPGGESETTADTVIDLGFHVDPQAQLQREYVRFVLGSLKPAPSPWLAEGLAELCMRLRITETEISLGRVESLSESDAPPPLEGAGVAVPRVREDHDFNRSLTSRSLLPLDEMFAVTADSTTAKANVNNAWAKQCYAFVHWGLYGDLGKNQPAFLTFLKRQSTEPITEALFKECFKKSYRDMLFTLRAHIESTRAKVAGVQAAPGQKIAWPAAPEVRAATEGEIGRIQSDVYLAAQKPSEARTALVEAYRRGNREPGLLAALGTAEYARGENTRARKLLEEAAKKNAVRPQAYLALARLRLAERLASPQAKDGKLSYEQLLGVLEPLLVARSQAPRLPELYQVFAEAWLQTAATPPAQHLALVDEGLRLFPDDRDLRAARERLGPTATLK